MSHDHDHDHGVASGRAFAISVTLNGAFVIVELVAGVIAHSLALVADAAHNFGDVLGLLLAWGAAYLAQKKPSRRRTYGLRRTTILASLANAMLLLVGVGAVAWEAIGRFGAPTTPRSDVIMLVAAAGFVINAGSALLFLHNRERDANVRGAFLHLAADAGVSLGVLASGVLLWATHAAWIDPAVSVVVSAVILVGTWSLLRDATNLVLDAVPRHVDPDAVRAHLAALPGVRDVHDLHIWAMSTTDTALTAHLVMDGESCHPAFLRDTCRAIEHRFGIQHSTLQVEAPDAPEECAHAPEGTL